MKNDYILRRKHGKIHIKKYIGKSQKVEIPQFIDGMPVTKIDSSAFSHSEISEIIIPDELRVIGTFAFFECKNLKKITFQGRIDKCSYAFINSAVEEIDGIEYLNVIDPLSFNGTPFYENNETLIIRDKIIWCKQKSDIIYVPDYIRIIGYRAFANSKAKKIVLPENLRKIENLAFFNSSIHEISIPKSVTEFGINALGCCFQLEKIRFPENFGKNEKWSCIFDVNEKNYIINDTQLVVHSDEDILIYENVSCIAVCHVYMRNPLRLRERQIFPEKLEYLKYKSILSDSKVSVFRNDTFKAENSGKVFGICMWNAVNAGRRFTIIFDFKDIYAEVLLYFPFMPYYNYKHEYKIIEFYEKCLVNAEDGRFFDFSIYDGHILEQDIPFRIKAEIACKRIKSGYRLTAESLDNYRNYFRLHRKKLRNFDKLFHEMLL